jgi:predicted amidophosphoribosyltransferase
MRWLTDIADLVLARSCVSCQAWGAPLCHSCLVSARHTAGRFDCYAYGTDYRGIGRSAILAHKRQLVRALAAPLGLLLADAIRLLAPMPTSLALVPIPPHREALRIRGQDTVHAVGSAAARELAPLGYGIAVVRALSRQAERPSLAGASRAMREAMVRGAFSQGMYVDRPVIVIDDVLTTGATVREAMRVLAGTDVRGAAVIAAVRSRSA